MSVNYNKERKLAIQHKAKIRRIRRIIISLSIVIFVSAAIIVGTYFFITYHTFSGYNVNSTTELGGSIDNLSYRSFSDGYIQCSSSGIVYFDSEGIIWDESFEMDHPLVDVCGDYAVVADMKQSDIYIYDKSGYVDRISISHDILDIEVSEKGTIALSTNDGDCNYIELKDLQGNDLINVKSIFSSSGYLMDITLSSDGTKLAAAFLDVSQGELKSRVQCYDFSSSSTDDMLVGTFDEYTGTVITTVEFMNSKTVCAIGDNALTIFNFKDQPEITYEALNLDWEVQSIDINSKYILLTTKDTTGENNYRAFVYNTSGKEVANVGFDFAFTNARLGAENIVLYGSTDCQIYSFKGLRRFAGSFDERITYMLPLGNAKRFILATTSNVRFISLK